MIFIILFSISAIVSLISLFYSVSVGYFDYTEYEKEFYSEEEAETVMKEKQAIIDKYLEKIKARR